MGVVRVGDLSGRCPGLERLARDGGTGLVAEATWVQLRAVVQSALLPTEWSGLATGASATGMTTGDPAACLAEQPAAAAVVARSAITRAAGSGVATAALAGATGAAVA